jgi:hypothetical protein
MAGKATQSQRRFVAERARALALVYLTRRKDLIVHEGAAEAGIDLWVTLNIESMEGVRKFGVKLSGIWSAVTSGSPDLNLKPTMQRMLRYSPFPFPVVLFFFTMENDEGWYTWVAEPVVAPNGGFQLVQHGEASCRLLTSDAIDQIVDMVGRWYDAFFARATRETPAKKRNARTVE